MEDYNTAQDEVGLTRQSFEETGVKLGIVVNEINEILGEFEECPFCQQAIGHEQLAKMREPELVGAGATKGVRKGKRKRS